MSHAEDAKFAVGNPQELGLGDPDEMSPGIPFRGKNQMLMALLVHSMASGAARQRWNATHLLGPMDGSGNTYRHLLR